MRAHLPLGVAIVPTGEGSPIAPPRRPLTVTLSLLFWLLLPLLFVVAVIDCASMSQVRRVRLLRSAGLSQSAIADRLQISRYRVRLALA